MRTILVTGSNGLLGQKLIYALSANPDLNCIATGLGPNRMAMKEGYTYRSLDVRESDQLVALIDEFAPESIINTAALTNVDACEKLRDEAVALNVTAVASLAAICRARNIHLVHLSTDFVFNGKTGPYVETDQPDPISHYAVTKYQGELALMESGCSWTILRTIIIYGVVDDNSRSNVVLWTINNLRDGKSIRVISDQYRSPTLAEDLADACIQAAVRKATGIYHVSGRETMCILDMARIVADFFKLDQSLINPVSSAELAQPASRPPVTGFIIRKAERDLDFSPVSFLQGLSTVKNQLLRNGFMQN